MGIGISMRWRRDRRSEAPESGASAGLAVARSNRWRAWTITAALWGLVGLGAVGGFVGLSRAPLPPLVDVGAVEERESVPPAVMGAGEWAVRVAIPATDTHTAGEALASPAVRPQRTRPALRVLSATAVAAERVNDDYWMVTVAAEVELESAGVDRWFFEVGVAEQDGLAIAVSDPALVSPPPSPAGALELAGTLRSPDLSDPILETVSSFLTALLSGDPAVGRWTAPGVDIEPAVRNGTFEQVRIDRASIDDVDLETRRVRVEVSATTPTDAVVVLAYEIVVVDRGDRWEVTAVTGAPTLSTLDGPASTPTSRAPAPSTPPDPSTSSTTPIAPDEGTSPNPYLYEEEET